MSRILAFALLAQWAGSTLLAASQDKTEPPTPTWVEGRILEIRPTPAERKFDTIAWVPSIKEALRLAKQHSRPVMMFTYDGQMQTGRC